MLGSLEIRNRVALAPMGLGLYEPDGSVPKDTLAYIEARAKGGVGLVISQFARATRYQKLPLMGAYEDRFIPSLKGYADVAHRYGAKVFLQIAATGGTDPLGSFAPSAVDISWYPAIPRELTREQIREIRNDFVQAAVRAQKAGFDGVELHGAYGYLIAEFISPFSNRRRDEYGDNFEGRMLLPVEIVRGIRSACGKDFPVGFKFNAHEDVPRGIDLESGVKIARRMVDENVIYLHPAAMASNLATVGLSKYPAMPILYHPQDITLPLTEYIKRRVGEVPVMAAGGIKDPDLAGKILSSRMADMVVLGRALLADPDWVNCAMSGRRIRPCIRCNVCHYEAVAKVNRIVCTVNPYLMRETKNQSQPTERRKRVMIVGGGPAGITAALAASRRKHYVTLFEKGAHLGGLLIAGSRPGFKADVSDLLDYLREEIADSDVELRLGKEVTPKSIMEFGPDVLVVAVGASPMTSKIKGLEKSRTLSVIEALLNPERVGRRPMILGGGITGCEAALHLAQQGKEVTIIEKLPELMQQEEVGYRNTTAVLTKMLRELGVIVCLNSEVIEATPSTALIRFGGMEIEVEADTLVLSMGLKPDQQLIGPLAASCDESYVIGDCARPGRIFEATHDGDRVGRGI
jgi:2,4-dienoyl-CoA reductase-like NADH-dependent reductase (Old Yellow Enzyme family)/thioredoxin reductase